MTLVAFSADFSLSLFCSGLFKNTGFNCSFSLLAITFLKKKLHQSADRAYQSGGGHRFL